MSYYVLIRGPLGVGKSAVSKRLAKENRAEYVSIDRILDEHALWKAGHLSEFLGANEFAAERAERFLAKGTPVVFDGNFYWKAQIADLVGQLDYVPYIFTLNAPLAVCIERDWRRGPSYGREATRAVYAKSGRFDAGVGIDATQPVDRVVSAIVAHLRNAGSGIASEKAGDGPARRTQSPVTSSRNSESWPRNSRGCSSTG